MKKTNLHFAILTFLLIFVSMVCQGQGKHQTIRKNIFIESTYNIENTYYKTVVDWGGVQSIVSGSIDDIAEAGQNLVGTGVDIWGNLIGKPKENEKVVQPNGDVQYTDNEGRVFTQKKVVEPRILPRIGYEIQVSPLNRFVEAEIAVSNGKYNMLSFAIRGVAKVFPMAVFGTVAEETSRSYRYNEESFLNNIYIGYETGYDSSYPGWVFLTKKTYGGLNFGTSVRLFKKSSSLNFGIMLQTSKNEGKIHQHYGFCNFKIPFNKLTGKS